MRIHVANGIVFPMDGRSGVLDRADVYIEGDRIVAVAPSEPPFLPEATDQRIEANGCYVLPGFVNAHGHLSLGLFRGLGEFLPGQNWGDHFIRQGALAKRVTDEDYFLAAQVLIAEMIRAGITSFADIHYEPPGAPPVTELIAQAVEASGIRAVVCLETNGYVNTGGLKLRHSAEEAERTFRQSVGHARKWHGRGDGRISAMLGLANPPVPEWDDLVRVARGAAEHGLPIQMHIAEIAYEMVEWQEMFGRRAIQVLREAGVLDQHVLGGNVVFLDAEDAGILRNHPFHASTCPQNCCKIALGMLDIPTMLNSGLNVCLGTNEVVNNNNLDMIEEMRFAALYHKMQRRDARVLPGDLPLQMITARGGRALGTGVGVLEAGRPADVIVMDASGPHLHPAHDHLANLTYAASSADTQTVIINGRIVMQDRRIVSFDAESAVNQLEARLAPLRPELPQAVIGVGDEPFELRWEVERTS
jgi:5-methylthioadenosine/S-adenosylhomocysteine deaminase